MKKKTKNKYRYRDAESGRMVSALYAAQHPTTTIRERIKPRP